VSGGTQHGGTGQGKAEEGPFHGQSKAGAAVPVKRGGARGSVFHAI
jgi:hypothetical protein